MQYIEQTLMQGETIIYRTQLHWIIFYKPLLYLFLAGCLFLLDLHLLSFIFFIMAAFETFRQIIAFSTSEFAITNRRIIIKVGFIQRHSLETLLQRVESIEVMQSILGRLLNYGSIIICGVGGSREPFDGIINPLLFRQKTQEQIETCNQSA